MRFLFFIVGITLLASCSTTRKAGTKDDGRLTVTFVQINDVYEIAPLEGGKAGGVARVATLKKEEKQKNPNTVLLIAGDFVSPSVYNSLKYEGQRIRGRQMVESFNAAGMDLAVFGNHEFDISENELQSRINESQFQWISSNTFHKTKDGIRPFVKTTGGNTTPFPQTWYMDFSDADGTRARIGFIGLNIPINKAEYVYYTNVLHTADSLFANIKDSCDAVVAITHLEVEEDSILARRIPQLALIMGGHEHDMRFKKVGNIYITKAHANAKSAYVNYLTIDKKKKTTFVEPKLVMIDTGFALDAATTQVVTKWVNIANENYASLGFDATEVVLNQGEALEGREIFIRATTTNLTQYIVAAMEKAAPEADLALLNSGSIRVDDVLPIPVTQYDIIRALPYGGFIQEVDMKGSLLNQILDVGKTNLSTGGFLQYSSSLKYDNGVWKLKEEPIHPDKVYHVALSDFLMTGGEANMGFLTKDNPGIVKMYAKPKENDIRRDIRLAIIDYLKSL